CSPSSALQQAIACRDVDCLIWPFARDTHGRGQIFFDGRRRQVHPLVCEGVHGSKPTAKHETAHLCDNGRGGCVNGTHLVWATRRENLAMHPIKARRGRKIADDTARKIRTL